MKPKSKKGSNDPRKELKEKSSLAARKGDKQRKVRSNPKPATGKRTLLPAKPFPVPGEAAEAARQADVPASVQHEAPPPVPPVAKPAEKKSSRSCNERLYSVLAALTICMVCCVAGLFGGTKLDGAPPPAKQAVASVPTATARIAQPTVELAQPTEMAVANTCDRANLIIPALEWTDWLPAENQVCMDAVKIRPEPFEAPVFDVTSVVQLATDFDDTDPKNTLREGILIYEYDLPAGVRPVYQASQSDIVTSLSLCWQREERDGNPETLETQLLMRIQPHNGGSALVTFIPVQPTDVPPIGSRCDAEE
jgi:hypothetical protein